VNLQKSIYSEGALPHAEVTLVRTKAVFSREFFNSIISFQHEMAIRRNTLLQRKQMAGNETRSERFWHGLLTGGFLLVGARPGQHAFHRVIAFVAGVFDDGSFGFLHGDLPGPGLGEGSSTVNSYRMVSGAVRVKRMFWLER
jgi:hypothetical protein